MNRKKGIKILTELVNIEDIKVISHRQHEGIGIILQIEPGKKESVCPRCRTKIQRLHQNHEMMPNAQVVADRFHVMVQIKS